VTLCPCFLCVQVLAQAGLAPSLFGVYPLDPVAAGWSAIVMEHVDVRDVSSQDRRSVLDAVQYLHDLGFLHGDLRSPNVKVRVWGQARCLCVLQSLEDFVFCCLVFLNLNGL